MPASLETRGALPAQRALVATVIIVAVLLLVTPLLVWPVVHIASTPTATVRLGEADLDVLIADTLWRQRYGLQGRGDLGEDSGMLFVFPSPVTPTFARKTVPFDLEVVFVDGERRVTAIAPLDEEHTRATGPAGTRYAVEVRAGWCDEHDVEPGIMLALPRR